MAKVGRFGVTKDSDKTGIQRVRTDRDEREEMTQAPPGDLPSIYREAPIGLCYLDRDLRYLHINDWLAAINGRSVEEHLGRAISEVIPDVAAGIESQLRRVIETGEPVLQGTAEGKTPAQSGEKRYFEHDYHAVRSKDGTVVGVS